MNLSLRASLGILSAMSVLIPAVAAEEASSSSSAASVSSGSSSSSSSLAHIEWKTPIPQIPSSCDKNPNKDLCIPDHIRNLERARLDFVNEMARLRKQWLADHASMGRTTEYLMLLQQYSEHLKREGDIFADKLTAEMKKVSANRTNPRGHRNGSSSSVSSEKGQVIRSKVDEQALAKCAVITDEIRKRICIRTQSNRAKFRPMSGKTYK